MNRVEIKEKAKEIVKENLKEFWKGYLLVIAISFLCTLVISILFEKESIISYVLTLVSSFFVSTLSVGLSSYVLKIVRKEEYSREDIFKYVGAVIPIATINILTTIFTLLGSLLFVIPGVIVALAYSMVFLMYVEDDSLLPMDYLFKSKALMHGYKWDYFIFILSFLGWTLFVIITLGVGLIWVVPYITVSEIIYYDELKKIKS